MASKFQNRLVGTILLVALGVIVLPNLLDGSNKRVREELAAIPLVPQPGDIPESEQLPPITQSLPAKPSVVSPPLPEQITAPPPAANASSAKPTIDRTAPNTITTNKPMTTAASTAQKARKQGYADAPPPTGQAWVIQLGALKNADKVNEIVAKLRLSGYHVYTLPVSVVQGGLTTIFVGPDSAKEKMQQQIDTLHRLTGLRGIVKAYRVP